MGYITIPQLARMLGMSRITVYKKVKSGEIKATRVGHTYMIPDKEIARVTRTRLTGAEKRRIERAVKKTVEEYGEVLERLGNE